MHSLVVLPSLFTYIMIQTAALATHTHTHTYTDTHKIVMMSKLCGLNTRCFNFFFCILMHTFIPTWNACTHTCVCVCVCGGCLHWYLSLICIPARLSRVCGGGEICANFSPKFLPPSSLFPYVRIYIDETAVVSFFILKFSSSLSLSLHQHNTSLSSHSQFYSTLLHLTSHIQVSVSYTHKR